MMVTCCWQYFVLLKTIIHISLSTYKQWCCCCPADCDCKGEAVCRIVQYNGSKCEWWKLDARLRTRRKGQERENGLSVEKKELVINLKCLRLTENRCLFHPLYIQYFFMCWAPFLLLLPAEKLLRNRFLLMLPWDWQCRTDKITARAATALLVIRDLKGLHGKK